MKIDVKMAWATFKDRLKIPVWWPRDYSPFLLGLLIALVLFLALVADLRAQGWFFQVDAQAQHLAGAVANPVTTGLMIAITFLANRPVIALTCVIIGLVIGGRRQWQYLVILVLAYFGGEMLLFGLKDIFQRSRPATSLVEALGYSFPSGHALAVMIIYGFLAYLTWHGALEKRQKQALLALLGLVILLVGVSRVYLQTHWLTDVLAGYLAGFAWLMVILMAGKALHKRLGEETS